jgi:hypothetical protein
MNRSAHVPFVLIIPTSTPRTKTCLFDHLSGCGQRTLKLIVHDVRRRAADAPRGGDLPYLRRVRVNRGTAFQAEYLQLPVASTDEVLQFGHEFMPIVLRG